MESPWIKGVLIALAIIGALALLAILVAAVTHGGMMGMMHSFGNMMAACQAMMPALR